MAFGMAGAAAGASDNLQEMLARAFAQKQAEQQMALQQQAAARAEAAQAQQASQFQQTMGLQQQTFDANQADRTAQRERQATGDRQVENQRGVRRMIGDFLVQRGQTPLDSGARQTLQGMAVQEDVDLPKSVTDDPTAANAEWERRQGIEHKNRLGEIAATGANSARAAAQSAAALKADAAKSENAKAIAETRRQLRELAQSLYDDPALEGITGPIAGRRDTFFEGPSVDAKRRLDQLTNKLSLEERGKLKGQGAVSNFETEMLMKGVSAIDRAAGGTITKRHIKEILDAFQGDAPDSALRVNQAPPGGGLVWDPKTGSFQ